MPEPISTLALTQLIDSGGTYPQPGQGTATNVMAMIRTLAYGRPAYGAASCEGQQLAIATHQALFSLLGTAYGGDGRTGFAVPNLRRRIAIGGGPDQGGNPPALGTTHLIAADAAASAAFPMVGSIGLFAGVNAPAGWLVADGSVLPVFSHIPLFEAIGGTFGGDGTSTFALPDLQGRAALGVGEGPVAAVWLGQQVDAGPDTPVAGLGLNYIVNVSGNVPPTQGSGGFPDSSSVLGEVIAFAGLTLPVGWLPADGREMTIEGNESLFELIGTSFGGDGQESFALPDLRTNMVEGT